jgi:hypothetical protein
MVSQAGADALIRRTRNARIMGAVLLAAVPLIAFATRCPGQEPENQDHDAALTPEQWQQRVGEARRRSEEFVARRRTQTEDPVSSQKEQAEAQDQRALNDPTLLPGDIVATSKGFVVFVGRAEQHQSGDFQPLPPGRRSLP